MQDVIDLTGDDVIRRVNNIDIPAALIGQKLINNRLYPIIQYLRECLNGMLSNGLDLSDKPAQNALQDSPTKIKSRECRFPQKEIAESCIKFEGNIVSLNLKTGKITTT